MAMACLNMIINLKTTELGSSVTAVARVRVTACSFRGEADESFEHIFVTCHYNKKFWAEVIKWMGNLDIEIEPLSNKDIMFGIMDCKRDLYVNRILLISEKICLFLNL